MMRWRTRPESIYTVKGKKIPVDGKSLTTGGFRPGRPLTGIFLPAWNDGWRLPETGPCNHPSSMAAPNAKCERMFVFSGGGRRIRRWREN